MARLPYPPHDSPDAQQMIQEIRAQRGGRLPHLFDMQLHNPAITDGWLRLGTAVRYKSELDDATRELAICLVARLTGAEYEWQAHSRLAAAAGFSDERLQNILSWRNDAELDERHRAVLGLVEQLTRDIQVEDDVFDAVRPHLSNRQILELVTTVAYYNMVARFLVGLQIDLET
ncbi:MAG: carboxymuconolactone decarboxylase family protein [Chloroflexota bacterium]